MKKLVLFAMMVALMAVFAVGANALTVSVGTLGGESQKRDVNATSTITITNDGNASVDITNVAPRAGFDQSRYMSEVSGASFPAVLSAGSSLTLTLQAYVPVDFDAVDESLQETAFKIGDLVVTADSNGTAVSAEAPIMMQAENEIRLRRTTLQLSGSQDEERSVGDGSRVRDVKPGDSVSMKVNVQNTFSSSSSSYSRRNTDVYFDIVDVRMVASGDEDFDFMQEEDSLSLPAGEEDYVTLEFDVYDDADDRSHTIDIEVIATDEYGARHGEKMSFTLEVERDAHDLVFRSSSISAPTCNSDTLRMTANIRNRGRLNERDVVVEMQIPDLGIVERSTQADLDSDDSRAFDILTTLPDDVAPGVYEVHLYSMFDMSVKSNYDSLTFTVPDCAPEEPEPEEPEPKEPKVVQPPVITQPTDGVPAKLKDDGLDNETLYLYGLVAAIALVFVLIVVLLVVALKRK